MKRVAILLLLASILSGCAVTRERIVETQVLDFRPYTEMGFFLSPDPYPGEFDALGEIYIHITPALLPASSSSVNFKENNRKFDDPILSGVRSPYGSVRAEVISSEELVEIAVQKAKSLGANGIADLKCQRDYEFVSGVRFLRGYDISGLAILRK